MKVYSSNSGLNPARIKDSVFVSGGGHNTTIPASNTTTIAETPPLGRVNSLPENTTPPFTKTNKFGMDTTANRRISPNNSIGRLLATPRSGMMGSDDDIGIRSDGGVGYIVGYIGARAEKMVERYDAGGTRSDNGTYRNGPQDGKNGNNPVNKSNKRRSHRSSRYNRNALDSLTGSATSSSSESSSFYESDYSSSESSFYSSSDTGDRGNRYRTDSGNYRSDRRASGNYKSDRRVSSRGDYGIEKKWRKEYVRDDRMSRGDVKKMSPHSILRNGNQGSYNISPRYGSFDDRAIDKRDGSFDNRAGSFRHENPPRKSLKMLYEKNPGSFNNRKTSFGSYPTMKSSFKQKRHDMPKEKKKCICGALVGIFAILFIIVGVVLRNSIIRQQQVDLALGAEVPTPGQVTYDPYMAAGGAVGGAAGGGKIVGMPVYGGGPPAPAQQQYGVVPPYNTDGFLKPSRIFPCMSNGNAIFLGVLLAIGLAVGLFGLWWMVL